MSREVFFTWRELDVCGDYWAVDDEEGFDLEGLDCNGEPLPLWLYELLADKFHDEITSKGIEVGRDS
jgi:hypothetical protein